MSGAGGAIVEGVASVRRIKGGGEKLRAFHVEVLTDGKNSSFVVKVRDLWGGCSQFQCVLHFVWFVVCLCLSVMLWRPRRS